MNYRKIKADRIFDGQVLLDSSHVLVVDKQGSVIDLVPDFEAGEDLEIHKGLLCPGFVNAHCHLELSHLKDVIPTHTGLIPFLLQVIGKRDFPMEHILEQIELAEQEMFHAGIVAVGDIGNTDNTLATKKKSAIAWNNFVEILGSDDSRVVDYMSHYGKVCQSFRDAEAEIPPGHFKTALVPHAPYTVGAATFQEINAATAGQVISIHNQETPAEDQLYKEGKGDFLQLLERFGHQSSPFPVTGQSALRSWLPHFTQQQRLLLVHNTFTPVEDMHFAIGYAKEHLSGLHFCLCANANLYIENSLPPVIGLMDAGAHIVLGTDSYSSNHQLSIAAEIKTIRSNFPTVPIETILQWATLNGAEALNRADMLGSFEKGKKPGVVLLDKDMNPKRLA
jgi:cytosine/adenosine deaminase-related metal-dependent hydrolase